jgi:hypothetical protein
VKECVLDDDGFWTVLEGVHRLMAPIVAVLRIGDSDAPVASKVVHMQCKVQDALETMNLDWVDVVGCDSEAVRKIVLDHHCARWIYSLTDVQVRLTLFCFSWRRCSPALRH